ncbi:hypothetical protein ACN28S_49810 [Cystobacter fuscus]
MEPSSPRTREQRLAVHDFQAANTNSARDTTTSARIPIFVAEGETVMIGTWGITGSASSGDTYLRLFAPDSTEVAENDDANPEQLGSRLAYTAATSGMYLLQAGCLGNSECSGTIGLSRRKAVLPATSLSNTNDARLNTFNRQYYFNGGETIRVSTCAATAYGASATGDTFLRIFPQTNGGYTTEVAVNDNACGSGGTASEIVYSVPVSGYYQIRVGCAANTACSGMVAVYTE